MNFGHTRRVMERTGSIWPRVTNPEEPCDLCTFTYRLGSRVIKYRHLMCQVHKEQR